MGEIETKRIRINREIKHNRGKIIEDNNGYYTLYIGAIPEPYNVSNWSAIDLKDLADSINKILKVVEKKINGDDEKWKQKK